MFYKRKRSLMLFLIFVATVFFFFGCQDDNTTGPDTNGKGTIKLKVTDDPFPADLVAKANVTIKKIEIRRMDKNNNATYVNLFDGSEIYDLTTLRNGITADLPGTEVAAGTYNQVRVYISDASIELTNGQTYSLKIPSAAQSGLKINIKPDVIITENATAVILLDFDLSKSFVVQGNQNTPAGINGFIFKPVLRATFMGFAGSISGSVTDSTGAAINNANVWVSQDSTITTTLTNESGIYKFIGLYEGTYSVSATKIGYDTLTVPGVNVNSGDDVNINLTLKVK